MKKRGENGTEKIRLDHCLASLGIGSRSEVKDMIRKGQVTIDGQVVRDPSFKFQAGSSEITVKGKQYIYKTHRTIMMNKAAGILTAARDSRQKTVLDELPALYRAMNCMPAGRLDKDTTGLLILTSDGELAHRLISPDKEVGKTYDATVDGPFTKEDAATFAAGMHINDSDGDFDAKPAITEALRNGDNESLIRVTITEGKYHQVKRMFAMCGLHVTDLHRRSIGQLSLDERLEPGAFRELSEEEIELLFMPASAEK